MAYRPLADEIRPSTLDEVVGQQHIIGKDKLLYRAIKADKLSSIIFAVVMIAVLATSLTLLVFHGVQTTGVIQKNTTAAVVGDHKINSLVMNYYYNDTVSNTYNEWTNLYGADTAMMVSLMQLDLSKPLDAQDYDETKTYADHFAEQAIEMATETYAVYTEALKNGNVKEK